MSTRTRPPVAVVDPVHRIDRIDDAPSATTARAKAGGQRAVPYHCPFCAGEDLRPHAATSGAWHCRSCLRAFSVRFLGLEALSASATDDPHSSPTPELPRAQARTADAVPSPATPPPTRSSVPGAAPTGGPL